MGNCLRLGISRVGLAWSKWRMAAKFKRKNISVIVLGMQAVGKTTIALRLYKFKRALPDTKYVQTKGFNTYTVKKKKTTVNIYDLGGHPSIQELWDHYYADSHGVVFVVDTSKRETVPEAGQLLSKVLSDHRIRGKPILLLANKIDLDGVTETELDAMLNLQQLVNSVRCLTRLDVSCATDLKNDKGIFEGFKWLISYIESNYHDLNTRVLSDTMEEKKREKVRREAVKAAREAEKAEEEEENAKLNELNPGSPLAASTPTPLDNSAQEVVPNGDAAVGDSARLPMSPEPVPQQSQPSSAGTPSNRSSTPTVVASKGNQDSLLPENPCTSSPRPISVTRLPPETAPVSKIPLPLLPPINNAVTTPFVDQPIKLPRLKSPKSRPEIINRIEDTGAGDSTRIQGSSGGYHPPVPGSDQYYDEKGFRFRKISAARRMSPEGADSDDGIVNMAYEPSEDLSSDSTPIGIRKHNFAAGAVEGELPNREIFMITTLAEVHKEYFKERKGSTSTHDSISMSMMSDSTDIAAAAAAALDDGQSAPASLHESLHNGHPGDVSTHAEQAEIAPNKKAAFSTSSSSSGIPTSTAGKSKKRINTLKPRSNKTGPAPLPPIPVKNIKASSDNKQNTGSGSRTPSASSKVSASSSGRMPFTVSNAWGSTEIPEHVEMNSNTGAEPAKF